MKKSKIELHNQDCLPVMKQMQDNEFDLAIVDPPFGIGQTWAKSITDTHYKTRSSYSNSEIPTKEYFDELKRVSRHQIIWGINYYGCPKSNNLIVWDKCPSGAETFQSAGELAWTSIKKHPFRIYRHHWSGARKGLETGTRKIHPHQKPVGLYKWILQNYAEKGWSILDTHIGSASIAIACWDLGFDLTGFEIDEDHYNVAMKRIETHKSQLQLIIE